MIGCDGNLEPNPTQYHAALHRTAPSHPTPPHPTPPRHATRPKLPSGQPSSPPYATLPTGESQVCTAYVKVAQPEAQILLQSHAVRAMPCTEVEVQLALAPLPPVPLEVELDWIGWGWGGVALGRGGRDVTGYGETGWAAIEKNVV